MIRYFIGLVFLAGCSATKEISTSNHYIQREAMSIIRTNDIKVAHKHANNIISESSDIAGAVGNVKDTIPWWGDMITYGAIALAVIGVCFLLWYTGVGSLIKKVVYSLGLFIPDKKLQQAKVLAEAKDDTDPTTIREAIAVMRASDPAFDAAYKKVSK
jgi:hypothetical protein